MKVNLAIVAPIATISSIYLASNSINPIVKTAMTALAAFFAIVSTSNISVVMDHSLRDSEFDNALSERIQTQLEKLNGF